MGPVEQELEVDVDPGAVSVTVAVTVTGGVVVAQSAAGEAAAKMVKANKT